MFKIYINLNIFSLFIYTYIYKIKVNLILMELFTYELFFKFILYLFSNDVNDKFDNLLFTSFIKIDKLYVLVCT